MWPLNHLMPQLVKMSKNDRCNFDNEKIRNTLPDIISVDKSGEVSDIDPTRYEAIDHAVSYPAKVFMATIESSVFHWHYDYELIVMLRGRLLLMVGPARQAMQAGDILLINSKDVHAYQAIDHDNLCLLVQFPESVFSAQLAEGHHYRFELNSASPRVIPHQGFGPLVRSVCKLGYFSRQDSPGSDFRAAAAFYDLLARLTEQVSFETIWRSTSESSEPYGQMAARVSAYVDEHLEQPDLAETIQNDLHLNEKQIYRSLKNALGMTFKQLTDTARINKAKQLLRGQSADVLEIAAQCGFFSEATFYRVFKKQTGHTPAEYRRQGEGRPAEQAIQTYLNFNANEADHLLAIMAFATGLSGDRQHIHNITRFKEDTMATQMQSRLSTAERAAELVSRMTLEEKIMQVGNNAAAIPRLGLNRYDYWSEASHGFFGPFEVKDMDVTSYPVCLAMSQSWDRDKIRQVTQAISDEIRAHHNLNGIELHMWCPTINLARDPRNGRSDENFGEDPFLAGKMAASYIQGLQGAGESDYLKAVATPKHYGLNSSENNRHFGSANVDEATLREYYAKVFEYAVREGGAQSIMTSYNRVNGVPASVNDQLLTEMLREEWGFDGFVVSDCGAVADCYRNPMFAAMTGLGHFYCKSMAEASAMTLIAGTDISCGSEHKKALLSALQQGLISENIIDRAVIRALTSRFRLGLFDDPTQVPFSTYGNERICSQTQQDLSTDMANDTIVLLKNENDLLPIDTGKVKNILVVGPNAIYRQLGGYSAGQSPNVDTPVNIMALDGIRQAADEAGIDVAYQKGWCIGKEFGQGGVFDALPGFDPSEMIIDINPGLEDDNPMAALSAAFGKSNESKKRHVPQDPDYQGDEETLINRAVSAAREADLVIVVAGTDESTGSEEKDRETLELPYGQDEKIQKLIKANSNTVVVLVAMGAVTGEFIAKTPALLNAHFAGQAQGTAIANILFGKVNPNAKLSATWYQSVADLPHVNDYGLKPQDTYDKKARTYQYFDQPVMFPFGFGLSYTRYEYNHLKIEEPALDANETLRATVDITNAGDRDGSEIIQLYIAKNNHPKQPDNKPIRQLYSWRKVFLKAGETKTVEFEVPLKDVTFWSNLNKKMVVETGNYTVEIGPNSADLPCRDTFAISGHWDAKLANVFTLADSQILEVGARTTVHTVATLEDTSRLDLQNNPPVYASTNDAVVTVDSQGVVEAVGAGVASISCIVTDQGQSMRAAIPIAVKAGGQATV